MSELMVRNEKMERTPEAVGAEIRSLTSAAKYMTLFYAAEIGRRLEEAKTIVPHGEWMDFLKRETEFSSSAANRFMTVYKEYGSPNDPNFPTLGNISVSNALRLLAVPEEERESFAAEVDAEHLSVKQLEAAIKERDEAIKALEKANEEAGKAIERAEEAEQTVKEFSEENVSLTDDLAEAKRKIRELESRPVEVAVQEPSQEEIDKAVAMAMEESEKAHAAEVEQLRAAAEKEKAERDKLNDRLKETAEKLKKISNGGSEERKKLETEVAQLKKQLSLSGKELTIFKIRFEEWQGTYKSMLDLIGQMPEEQAQKCREAMAAVLKGWGE